MFSSIVAPFGASLPNAYFVPSGAVVACPSLSVNVGASVVTSTPAFPSLSEYDGVSLSAVVCSGAFCVAVAVIVALSAVIAVPGSTDQVGFSYPSFAVTVGYLSAVNAVPAFTSYTLLFAMSFTPSPFVNVTLTYPSGVGLSSFPVLSMISNKVALALNVKIPRLL